MTIIESEGLARKEEGGREGGREGMHGGTRDWNVKENEAAEERRTLRLI